MAKIERDRAGEPARELALTPRMRQTLQRAAQIATEQGVACLGTEHMILAILDDPAGIAGSVIRQLGFETAIREGVEQALATGQR
jgi:ATP-dependent Clp protease ATP-binding subunit ClpA